MRAYSQDLRDRVIAMYKTGLYSRVEIARFLKLARDTVSEWIRRYISTGDYSSKQHCQTGRVRKFDNKQKVLDYLVKNPDATALEMRDHIAPGVANTTFYDSLVRMGITYKKRAKIQGAARKRSWEFYEQIKTNFS